MSRSSAWTVCGLLLLAGGAPALKAQQVDTSKLTPLTDLGTKEYQGFPGGLYPGGANERPTAHEAAGVARAKRVQPLDAEGRPSQDGKIVLLGIGFSNTVQAFNGFMQAAKEDPALNPKLVLVNGAVGGMSANMVQNPDEGRGKLYWATVDDRLKAAGVTRGQVQAVWIKETNPAPHAGGFPKYVQQLQAELANIVRIVHTRFPNAQLAYLSSRTYGGWAKGRPGGRGPGNSEPYSYETGFAVKWLIEQQLKVDPALNFDPARGAVKAPWLSWAAYLWANGSTPRKDGFRFELSDFQSNDQMHESPAGQRKVGKELLRFFKTDPTTREWFVKKDSDRQGPARNRPDPAGISGSLVIAGGGKLPEGVTDEFVKLAGGEKAKLVIIPTASAAADNASADGLLAPWKARKVTSAVLLHTRSRAKADEPGFVEPLRQATGVWFNGGSQARIAEPYVGTAVEKELSALLQRGGVIGGSSAGAAVMSRLMIASGNLEAQTAQGFDLLPGAVIDQHFHQRNREPRLLAVLSKNPGLFGVGIDEGTALVVRGRQMRALGESTVTFYLPAVEGRPTRKVELKPGAWADLTGWRNAAVARAHGPFPPRDLPAPEVAHGSLVIVGGGGMPPELTKKFIELAGGPDAPIVVLLLADPDKVPENAGDRFLRQAGARNVKVLAARKLADVEAPRTLELLKEAKGIWFPGGRQWQFVDAYAGTKVEPLFRDVLRRGGVIGGSSAGATIQGDYLCRGSPHNNTDMIYEGYEHGLAFLPGVAIDQHFGRRNRFADMTTLMKAYPAFLGIGIDEATALVVHGHVADIMGRGRVYFYDRRKPTADGKPDYETVQAGGRYDLKARKVLTAGSAAGG